MNTPTTRHNPKRGVAGGLLVLVAVMPFHAFFSVWLGSITHHQAIIQAWKEALLLILAAAATILCITDQEARDRLRSAPAILTGAFAIIALAVTVATRPNLTAILFGAKTDLEFLVAFVLAILVASQALARRMSWAVLLPSLGVIGFGLLQILVLPPKFLTHFGYGPYTILPYETIDPAIKSLRFASTLGGPNQLGTYLILPIALSAMLALRRRSWLWLALTASGSFVLFHTYSRAAWLGLAAAAIVIIFVLSPARVRVWLASALAALALIAAALAKWLLARSTNLQYYIFHSRAVSPSPKSSDSQHLASLKTGITDSLNRPLGHGLGTAGPAVFHSGTGLIIENNYLQISYETGLLGALVFVGIVGASCLALARRAGGSDLAAATLAAIVGVSVTALFLPAWTDSSTSLILWTAAGCVIGLSPDSRRV